MTNLTYASQSDFEDKTDIKGKVVLLDFYAEWCGPCRQLSVTLDSLATEMPEQIHIVKINVDENVDLAKRFKVRGIPQIVFMKNGLEIEKMAGARALQFLKDKTTEIYNNN
jgi:thioredoxin 1